MMIFEPFLRFQFKNQTDWLWCAYHFECDMSPWKLWLVFIDVVDGFELPIENDFGCALVRNQMPPYFEKRNSFQLSIDEFVRHLKDRKRLKILYMEIHLFSEFYRFVFFKFLKEIKQKHFAHFFLFLPSPHSHNHKKINPTLPPFRSRFTLDFVWLLLKFIQTSFWRAKAVIFQKRK